MRVCLVYDCLYPHTIGGAERWYRNLAERLASEGHAVTYLTLRQWERGADAGVRGVRVLAVGPRLRLYVEGRRRVLPPLVFAAGVLWHLLRHGRRYDVIHTASFPYFPVLAIRLAATVHRARVIVDWHEVWTRGYWREYLGRLAGDVGWSIQRACARVGDHAFCFSRLHAGRLRGEGFREAIEVLEGEYAGKRTKAVAGPAEPLVIFAGRHIPEKRVLVIPAVIAEARMQVPNLRCEIYGDGPQRAELLREIRRSGVEDIVAAPGFVDGEVIDAALSRSLCMLLPSRREGYGLIVVEAATHGTPSVVVRGPDNAATELIDEGENGFVADGPEPAAIARAIVRVHAAGPPLREATAAWFERNHRRLSLDSSLERVVRAYASL